jgi:hypothetical protein
VAQAVIGDVYASDASVKGSVLLAASGTRVLSGSTVTAGAQAAGLRLARGGDVRVCPGTTLTVSASGNGRDLMLGIGTGAVELHYDLGPNADTLVTPDFRILLAGPGTFHVAVSSDMHGTACVRGLTRNTASFIVTETMGDGIYQVHPHDQVWFRSGKVAGAITDMPGDCGCPEPQPVLRAEAPQPAKPPDKPAPTAQAPVIAATTPESSTPAAVPTSADGATHIEVDAPFVYNAIEPAVEPVTLAKVRLSDLPPVMLMMMPVVTPPRPSAPAVAQAPEIQAREPLRAEASPPRRGIFGKVRSFFAAMFR